MPVPRLPIDQSPVGESLVDANGDPVWPVLSDHELASLRATAETFQSTLVETQGRPHPTKVCRPGTVLAGSAKSETAARLYAHLTGRRFWTGPLTTAEPPQIFV